MKPRPGQIPYLLKEIFFETQQTDQVYHNESYLHLLALEQPWLSIQQEIEEIESSEARMYLRSICRPYTRDMITHGISLLNLDQKTNIRDFEKAVFLIGLVYDPCFDFENFQELLTECENKVRHDLEEKNINIEELSSDLSREDLSHVAAISLRTPLEKVIQSINDIFFKKLDIKGDRHSFFRIESHIPQALLEGFKTGIQLSISSLYIILGQRLGLPVYGVNLPRHFIAKYETSVFEIFVDPYNQGKITDRNAILQLLKSYQLKYNAQYTEACSFEVMVKRMIANLTLIFKQQNDNDWVIFLESISRNEFI